MRARLILACALCLLPVACGQNRDLPPAAPLGPELYVIEEGDRPEPGQFMRYAKPGPHGGGLDVAVTEYEPAGKGPKVVLVGAVHIADAPFYENIQRELDASDVVLYEGVKPSATSPVEWQKGVLDKSGEAGEMQKELAKWFGFRYQLDAIDYGRKNLVHADMSMEEFIDAGGAKLGLVEPPPSMSGTDEAPKVWNPESSGGAKVTRALPEAVDSMWKQIREFGRLAFWKPGPLQSLARRMFAETMGTQDIGTSLDLVPGLTELLLTKRNAVVIETLKAHLGDTTGTIGIFYGSAHMKGLQKILEDDLKYHRVRGHWVRAWALRPPLG